MPPLSEDHMHMMIRTSRTQWSGSHAHGEELRGHLRGLDNT